VTWWNGIDLLALWVSVGDLRGLAYMVSISGAWGSMGIVLDIWGHLGINGNRPGRLGTLRDQW